MGDPQNGWFVREQPIKMDNFGVPPFMESPIFFTVCWYILKLMVVS